MCASIREFGFKIPCLVRSDGEVVDGHLRLKAARRLGLTVIPVILCDEWTPAQVKAFRLMVNRSATWADWDDELLAQELLDLQTAGYDLSFTGFISGDTRAEWSEAFALVPGLEVGYVWHASKFTREVLDGLLDRLPASSADHLG